MPIQLETESGRRVRTSTEDEAAIWAHEILNYALPSIPAVQLAESAADFSERPLKADKEGQYPDAKASITMTVAGLELTLTAEVSGGDNFFSLLRSTPQGDHFSRKKGRLDQARYTRGDDYEGLILTLVLDDGLHNIGISKLGSRDDREALKVNIIESDSFQDLMDRLGF